MLNSNNNRNNNRNKATTETTTETATEATTIEEATRITTNTFFLRKSRELDEHKSSFQLDELRIVLFVVVAVDAVAVVIFVGKVSKFREKV